jgi:hypothetical protein
MRSRALLFFLHFFCGYCTSQVGAIYTNGASSTAMTSLSNQSGAEAIFANPAGLVFGQASHGAIVNYTDQFGLGEIARISVGGFLKKGLSHFALGINHYGTRVYKEQSILFSYARPLFQNFSVGLQYNLNTLAINSYNRVMQSTVNIGFQAKVNSSITMSGLVCNVLKTASDNYSSPQQMQFGILYIPSSTFNLFVEAIKQTDRSLSTMLGFRYMPLEKIELRLSADVTRAEIGFGAFYSLSKSKLGLAYANHQSLGGSYALSGIIEK